MTYNHKPKREVNLPKILKFNHLTLKGVLILLVVLSLFQLYISNSFVTDGEKINADIQQAEKLEEENLLLENNIEQVSSLAIIEKKAEELGLKKVEKVEYFDQPQVVASR